MGVTIENCTCSCHSGDLRHAVTPACCPSARVDRPMEFDTYPPDPTFRDALKKHLERRGYDTEFGPLAREEKTCAACGKPEGEWPMAHKGDDCCSQSCAASQDGLTAAERRKVKDGVAPEGGFGCGT